MVGASFEAPEHRVRAKASAETPAEQEEGASVLGKWSLCVACGKQATQEGEP